jgi:hypothetical protein
MRNDPKVLGGSRRFALAADLPFRAQNKASQSQGFSKRRKSIG